MSTADHLAAGLEPGSRLRCTACGNLTRFDVVETARTQRFHHFELSGEGRVEEETVLHRRIESVTCRWCGRDDAIGVETAPLPTPGTGRVAGEGTSARRS